MPSKLRKAIEAVKDQTSIGIAKVANNNFSSIEVAILKATRHDDIPVEERYVNEILSLISSDKVYAAACARAISKRIGKTRNWIVALKSLVLVLRIFQDGDPYFPREVLHAMKRGAKILNLSNFRDDSNSTPWDYTAFIRTFALYLDERLDCFLTGKLQRRFTKQDKESHRSRGRDGSDSINNMKPAMLPSKIANWQKMLDRAMATRPTGAAKTNKLVQVSLYAIVQESFDLYRDISDGVALLLDNFFHLQYESCVTAFQTCVKASKLFEELCSFYALCKNIGVGKNSEYPSVQKISEELIETLQEFLKDQSSFSNVGRSPTPLLLTAPQSKNPSSSSEAFDQFSEVPTERISESLSEFDSQCTSLEDLMSGTDTPASPSQSMDHYLAQFEKRCQNEDVVSGTDSGSVESMPFNQGTVSRSNSASDIVSLAGWPEDQNFEQEGQVQNSELDSNAVEANGWESVLAETARQQPVQTSSNIANESDSSTVAIFFDPDSGTSANGIQSSDVHFVDQSSLPEHHYNPFLNDITEIPELAAIPNNDQASFPNDNVFSIHPEFAAAPTFSIKNPVENSPWNNKENLFSQPATTSSREFSDSLFLEQSNQTPEVVTKGNSQTVVSHANDIFSEAPTFQAIPPTFQAIPPIFSAQNSGYVVGSEIQGDLFAPFPTSKHESNVSMNQNSLLLQQQLWIQQQDKIIAKNMF